MQATTPPRLSRRPQTPPTPRYGPMFDSPPSRMPRRAGLRVRPSVRASSPHSTFSTSTLSPPPSSPLGPDEASPGVRKSSRVTKRTAFVLPDSPEQNKRQSADEERTASRPSLLNPLGQGLPTPAKTPSRKRKLPEAVAEGGKVLFGSARRAADIFSTPRRTPSRRAGLSAIEAQVQEEQDSDSIPIYTDTSARRPVRDTDPDNPFLTRPGEETRARKSARQHGKNKLGPDGDRKDGMVYIFRGKKVFKKFTELPHISEAPADEDDNNNESDSGLQPHKIKPRLLFADAPHPSEEEAETDIDQAAEDDDDDDNDIHDRLETLSQFSHSSIVVSSKRAGKGPDYARMTPDESDGECDPLTSSALHRSSSSVVGDRDPVDEFDVLATSMTSVGSANSSSSFAGKLRSADKGKSSQKSSGIGRATSARRSLFSHKKGGTTGSARALTTSTSSSIYTPTATTKNTAKSTMKTTISRSKKRVSGASLLLDEGEAGDSSGGEDEAVKVFESETEAEPEAEAELPLPPQTRGTKRSRLSATPEPVVRKSRRVGRA